ncbi:MAG: hypothetical protein JEZ09_08075 [Salinivirgaceae bacterium]|nr:hypothetical protein [Salinivirgaceae bacterium]
MNNLGIVDTKKIIATINDSYGLNLADYSLTTLRRRFSHLMGFFSISLVDDFVQQISRNNIGYQELLDELMIDSTELFRDPSLWRELREKYFPEIGKTVGSKIWLPGITSGDELFSLMVSLKETELIDKIRVVASCPSNRRVVKIKEGGAYDLKKMEIGEANYTRLSGKFEFSKYYELKGNKAFLDNSLVKNVEFDNFNISQVMPNKNYRMIIFRNIMIQYNLPLYEKVIRRLVDSLTIGGYLVLGNKETLDHSEVGKKMQLVNETEKIYRKRID